MNESVGKVYGELIHRQYEELRENGDSDRFWEIHRLLKDFEREFPDECNAWKDRYSA